MYLIQERHYFFHLIHFRSLGQKSKNNFVQFLVQMRTRKFAFETYWPLERFYIVFVHQNLLWTQFSSQYAIKFLPKLLIQLWFLIIYPQGARTGSLCMLGNLCKVYKNISHGMNIVIVIIIESSNKVVHKSWQIWCKACKNI